MNKKNVYTAPPPPEILEEQWNLTTFNYLNRPAVFLFFRF